MWACWNRRLVVPASLAFSLIAAACGGGTAAQPTPTPAATVGVTKPSVPLPAASPSPSPSPAVLSPAATATPAGAERTYTVEAGDTLASIAQKMYGDSTQWRKIYDANRSAIGDTPDAVKIGTQLRIPPN
jgi:nucleoid-associated protein YgaU